MSSATSASSLIKWIDDHLAIASIKDSSLNGLQVESRNPIRTVAVAVDGALEVFEAAVEKKADLLIVHHGLFWGQVEPVVGMAYNRLRLLMESGMGLYAAHLPLDCHKTLGNNITLAKGLGLKKIKPFGWYNGTQIGFGGEFEKPLSLDKCGVLLSKITKNDPQMLPFGKKRLKKVAVVSGGGGRSYLEAAREGYDAFITGEMVHQDIHPAKEVGMTLLLGGHYATETFGVKNLGKALEKKFAVRSVFIDCPTGF